MTDFRYMKLGRGPGSTWFFVYNIPRELRGHPRFMTSRGKPMTKITESLETTDPAQARETRDRRVVYWNRQFRMLQHGPTEDDIREEAVEIYLTTLKANAASARNYSLWLSMRARDYVPQLDAAIEDQVAGEIASYCSRSGVLLTPGTKPYREIGIEFIKAKIAAGDPEARLPLENGREILSKGSEQHLPPLPEITAPVSPEPKPAVPLAPVALPIVSPETFSQSFEEYLRTALDGTSADTLADYRRKVKIFLDKVGDLPLNKITDHVAVNFLDKYLLGERKQKPRTRNTYAMLFSAIFKCAIRRKKAATNPFDGQRIKAANVHYEPFTDAEIKILFGNLAFEVAPVQHRTATALPWACLIGAYTGARLEEIAQLKASDIKQTDGVWFFEFCADGNGKTEAATRVVPLHRALVDAGLLAYRDALPKNSMLFPGLKGRTSKPGRLGVKLGDAFNWQRKKLGITRPGLNFHSFRHTVGDRLRKAGIQESDIAAVLGHEDERITSRVYGHDGLGLHRLAEIVNRISYDKP